jgi:hypothetical protein
MGHARKRALGMGVAAAIQLLSGAGLVCAESGEGAVVRLTDAKGKLTTLTTNKAGNFMLRFRGNTFAMPFTAKVMFKGNERVMATPQSTGNCAGCHTARGAAGAPGRILLPSR